MSRILFWVPRPAIAERIAIVDLDTGEEWSYRDLARSIDQVANYIGRNPRRLIVLFAKNDISSVIFYLSALKSSHTIFISPIEVGRPSALSLIRNYRPEIVIWKCGRQIAPELEGYGNPEPFRGYQVARRLEILDEPPPRELGIMLSTLGSSGNPKSVCLPRIGLGDRTSLIAESLGMSNTSRVLGNLPFGYIYGLSVLNSTLGCGGSLYLSAGSVADRSYWTNVASAGVTMIPTVSQTLRLMRTLNIDANVIPKLKVLTHSGEALDSGLATWLDRRLHRRGVKIYLMYGQTEAGGRMTVLEPEQFKKRNRSVGRPLRSCEIAIHPRGEIVFAGPGTMLGYATNRSDLPAAPALGAIVHTGDIGRVDRSGFLYVEGRLSRDRKIFGTRINLDEAEGFLGLNGLAAVVECNGVMAIFMELTATRSPSLELIAAQFRVPPQVVHIIRVPRLPRTPSGKIDYPLLQQMAATRIVQRPRLD